MNGFGKYFITLSTLLAIVVFHSDNVIANDANYKVECVKNMLNTTIKNTELKNMSKAKQKQAVVDAYFPYFDLEWNAKMSIGINYKKMTNQEQQLYLKEFAKFFSYVWLPYLYVDNTSGARLMVKDKTVNVNETDEYVDVVVYMPDGKIFNIRLRVRDKAGWQHCKILNAIIDGVDLAMSYRAQFDAYIEKNNGRSGSIIDYLLEKNHQYKRESGIILPID